MRRYWVIPPKQSAAFVAAMEDVLDVYHRPYDARFPVVCMDETNKQLIRERRLPIPPSQGRPARIDSEYERNGVANLFMFTEPLAGKRRVKVTKQRTRAEWAHAVKTLLDVHYPEAEKVILVMDNLNTHDIISFYETFPASEARRLTQRIEIHHTPRHGSWLNMAETELSALSKQCLDRRIATQEDVEHEVSAWEWERNNACRGIDWQFTTADARIKLRRLYPEIRT